MKLTTTKAAISAFAMALAIPAAANADVFDFTFTGSGNSSITASGTITTGQDNPVGSFFTPSQLITGLTGTYNGHEITALLAQGSFFGNDNILYYPSSQVYMGQPTYLDIKGVAFTTDNNRTIDFYFGLGGYGTINQAPNGNRSSNIGGTFTITPTATGAVPEPASWAMMLTGFGAMGGALRLGRRNFRAAIA